MSACSVVYLVELGFWESKADHGAPTESISKLLTRLNMSALPTAEDSGGVEEW